MKKKLVVALTVLCLVMSGCGSNDGPKDPGTAKTGQEEKDKDEADKLAESQDKKDTSDKKTSGSVKDTDKKAADKKEDTDKTTGETEDKTTDKTSAGTSSKGSSASDTKKDTGSASSTKQSGSTSSQKPSGSTGNSGNSGSTGESSSGGNTPAETPPSQPQEPAHTHNWVEETTTVTHEATGHYETKVIKEAWNEEIWEDTVVCGCGKTFKDDWEWEEHSIWDGCPYGYSVESELVDTIHHEAETEQVWVEDSPAWTETVGTGTYKCSSCGATK